MNRNSFSRFRKLVNRWYVPKRHLAGPGVAWYRSNSLDREGREGHCACDSVRYSETSPRWEFSLARGNCRHPDGEDTLATTVCQVPGGLFCFRSKKPTNCRQIRGAKRKRRLWFLSCS